MRTTIRCILTVSLATLCLLAQAGAKPAMRAEESGRYLGPHPIAARIGGGFCYIEVPHLHAYAPDRPALYHQVGDDYVFTGDPVPFGYDGPRTVFYGHHPVPVPTSGPFAPRPVFCMLRGPHYHGYGAPPQAPEYEERDGVVFYVGPVAPEWTRARPQVERALEAEYRPFVALRPHITVTPPPAWQGEVWVAPPVVQVQVPAPPSVQVVAPPPPQVHVVVPTGPAVRFVAPPPPRFQVVVPAPPSVVIMPPGPPGVIVAPGWGHPGKHHGWGKGGKHGHWH